MDNAFWNGAVMVYGDGKTFFRPLAGALDIAAHELTHGIIQRTVNLDYQYQAGALNESFADVFAVMVDRDDWLLGEDVVKKTASPSGALRDMADPHNGGVKGDSFWQPARMNEFVELDITKDNGGVHLNSGIPNHVCFLTARTLGREKTEQLYYRILAARYLNTRATFTDMRLAATQAATDLFGASSPEVAAVEAAFDSVGIVGGAVSQAPADLAPVEGEEWVALVGATAGDNSLFLARPVVESAADIVRLTSTQVLTNSSSPISVSRNGSTIVFIDASHFVRAIHTDGSGEQVISRNGQWASIALSPDGRRMAATTVFKDSTIFVFDLVDPQASKAIHLYNPTTQEGIETEVTRFADSMTWDKSGGSLLYDAFNSIPQTGGGAIDYWDVNLLDVNDERIFSLFPAQPEGTSIGNPSFAQTNDSFIAFDRVDFNTNTAEIWAADLFAGTANAIEANGTSIGAPKYAPDDSQLIFQRIQNGVPGLRKIPLAADKIRPAGPSQNYLASAERGVWFVIGASAGEPTSVGSEGGESLPDDYQLEPNYPNPFNGGTAIRYSLPRDGEVYLAVYDLLGQEVVRLESGFKLAGLHAARWDGMDRAGHAAASGVYLCRLQAWGASDEMIQVTRVMTLLR